MTETIPLAALALVAAAGLGYFIWQILDHFTPPARALLSAAIDALTAYAEHHDAQAALAQAHLEHFQRETSPPATTEDDPEAPSPLDDWVSANPNIPQEHREHVEWAYERLAGRTLEGSIDEAREVIEREGLLQQQP